MSNPRKSTKDSETSEMLLGTEFAVYKHGLDSAEIAALYNKWASYDQMLNENDYKGPSYAANTIRQYLSDTLDCKIVDVGAGSGLVGAQLHKMGFTNIVYMDKATDMLNSRRESYTDVLPYYIGEESQKHIANDTFDCAVSCGAFGANHIPLSGINELIRITKPGGIIVTVMREEYLSDYRDLMDPYLDELQQHGCWSKLQRTVVDNHFQNKAGLIYVYKVIQAGFAEFNSKVALENHI